MVVHEDCIHFSGYKPCLPHKLRGVHCDDCSEYRPISFRILILKVGLAGEVLRCTPILRRLRELYPQAEITWVTSFPEFVPTRWVQRLLRHSWETSLRLQAETFDLLLSLDKDTEVCALAEKINARQKRGFGLGPCGKISPIDPLARRKWLTGIFDDAMLANTRHYVAEMFEICGWEWRGETYLLENVLPWTGLKSGQRRIGLNTGTGSVWTTRIWPTHHWEALIQLLQKRDFEITLLGGPQEHDKNLSLARSTGARYEGTLPFPSFFGLVDSQEVIVTSVTMAMHVAIACEKPVVLFNNIFNVAEFHLYGRGTILQPALPCLGCYKPRFDSRCPVSNCMELISPEEVAAAVVKLVPGSGSSQA